MKMEMNRTVCMDLYDIDYIPAVNLIALEVDTIQRERVVLKTDNQPWQVALKSSFLIQIHQF